ncbi:GNAT family N-acetyltransferase [Colwellia sp. 12G3]|uniref:GNAT family N-acetyltransferase n=1 Tax=Colwellia sp. 12G3 TaxID=2058299 RepID=UPI000C34FABC|nr:GNAT family N-acetyltransferase [Colwellia sp. 12G3]PKI15956.1 GNAT family N-acetyltransferase [Colwellia sp. 12G3]
MDIRKISWDEALPIRHEVLWPNKSLLFCQVKGDDIAKHYGVYLDDKLVSVASIYIEDSVARLRKFATLVAFQGRGIGSKLITHILSELINSGTEDCWCDARTTAVGFYQKFGMQSQGTEFNKSGIWYFKMAVSLIPSTA